MLTDAGGPATRWAQRLELGAIPAELIAQAPASPYFFDPEVFAGAADRAVSRSHHTPSGEAAQAALPREGTVLDVGVGAGAASLPLRPGHIVGVDANPDLLALFIQRADRNAIPSTAICGLWPDVAPVTPICDVAVCHHVFYNVSDLVPFARALSEKAARRVVVELTAKHPLAWMAAYWAELHGWTQPEGPTADDAMSVLRALGYKVNQSTWRGEAQMMGETGPHQLARLARRLCLPASRHDELQQIIDRYPPPVSRELITLWWDVGDGA